MGATPSRFAFWLGFCDDLGVAPYVFLEFKLFAAVGRSLARLQCDVFLRFGAPFWLARGNGVSQRIVGANNSACGQKSSRTCTVGRSQKGIPEQIDSIPLFREARNPPKNSGAWQKNVLNAEKVVWFLRRSSHGAEVLVNFAAARASR